MRHFFLKDNKGVILITIYLVVVVLIVLGTALLTRVIQEAKTSERERHAMEALYIAEGAIHQMLFHLRRDMSNDSNWFDGDIDTIGAPPNSPFIPTADWRTVPGYQDVAMGDGTFTLEAQSVAGNNSAMRIRATGISSGITRRLLVNSEMVNLNAWNNVIFAGTGQAGRVINGNVDIRGSVHILGTDLTPSDLAMDLSGSGNIGNNYNGMAATLRSRVPDPPTVEFNGETVESLGAEVRVKNGKLGLSGAAVAGSSNVSGNSVKETLDGVYITAGYGGNQGAANVHSDNGSSNAYDGGDAVTFQTFDNSYKDDDGTVYQTYRDYVQNRALNLTTIPGWNGKIDADTPNFSASDPFGNAISWNQATGVLTLNKVVYAPGSVDIGKKNTTVLYDGVGTLVALGSLSDIKVHGDLLSQGQFTTNDTMAFIAERNVEIATGPGESQINVTALFYGQDEIKSAKQSGLVGVFNSNYFDMGTNVPAIYHVPSFDPSNHPGLIARSPVFFMKISSWQEIQ